MKQLLFLLICSFFVAANGHAQADKSQRPSPPATVKTLLASGATVVIDYSQPSLKGRMIGKDVEPKSGQLWRAGANEATTFEIDKPVTVQGKELAAGKYALFMMPSENSWTLIFNKVWKTWGAYDYEKNKNEDALQVQVTPRKTEAVQEKLIYQVNADGLATLLWGDMAIDFQLK
jgi:hypothetical protein